MLGMSPHPRRGLIRAKVCELKTQLHNMSATKSLCIPALAFAEYQLNWVHHFNRLNTRRCHRHSTPAVADTNPPAACIRANSSTLSGL